MSQPVRGVDTRWQPRSTDTGGVPTGPRTGLTRRMVPVISRRTTTLNTLNDDHGDQFPGALPASSAPAGADEQFVRMHAAYVQKVNAAVQADREGLAHELAERTFA